MEQAQKSSVGARTVQGVLWAYGSYVGGRLLVLATTAFLARTLVPEDFGTVALALTFMALLQGVKDLGVGQALVVGGEEGIEARAETAFALSILLGLVMSAAVVAISPLAADFYDDPDLTPIVAVLGCNFLLQSFGSTHYAIAQTRLDFRSRTVAELADVVVRGAVGIGLALAGAGAWALVIGYLAGSLALTIAIWSRVSWRPRLTVQRAEVRSLLSFGGTLSGLEVVALLIGNVDYIFVGKVLGSTALGYYTLGFRLPELLLINLAIVAGSVLYPSFASFDRSDLARAFLVSVRYTMLIITPLTVGMVILAEPVILTLFGEQWRESIEPMRVIAIYAFSLTVGVPAGTAYKATGRAGVLLALALVRLVLVVTALALFIDQGLVAVAACQAGVAGVVDLAGIGIAARLLDVRIGQILREAVPALISTAAITPVVAIVALGVSTPALALALGAGGGAILYAGVVWLVSPQSVRYVLDRLRNSAPQGPADPDDPLENMETEVVR